MTIHSFINNTKGRRDMTRPIHYVAVIGSGVMGSGIAAHLANVGVKTLLLDVVPSELTEKERKKGLSLDDKQVRNRLGLAALHSLLKQKPAPLTSKERIDYIEVGNLEDDFMRLQEVDWIIEVIIEKLDVKQQLFEKIDAIRKPGTIVSSNTSGLSVSTMSAHCSAEFQAHFLGTHFFNPPRYLKLLELIPTEKTKETVVNMMKKFGENILGKGVVICKDTPNFIANRVGTYSLLKTVQKMIEGNYSIGEVDSLTGPLIGHPKSATFRTLDLVGLDTFVHVANNMYEATNESEKNMFRIPLFIEKMVEKGWIGNKSRQGFYKKTRTEGKLKITELNIYTLQYEKTKKLYAPSLEQAKRMNDLGERLKMLVSAQDRAGQFIWGTIKPVLLYSAEKMEEIADDFRAIDEAMKWGFGWKLGPFELWDALGVEQTIARMESEGESIPSWVKEKLNAGEKSFYTEKDDMKQENERIVHLKKLKPTNIVHSNRGATLLDIGEEVALLEFHSPKDAIGLDVVQMINKSIDEVEKNYRGLVISHEGENFCVGANLMMILMEAQDENFFEIDLVIRQFQQAMSRIRYAKKPVVVAPFGMTLGGGAEICLPSASVQAALETYIGLVEVGVGLIPGGGGNKELYLRHLERLPNEADSDLQSIANKTFETIALATVSSSAHEGKENGFFSERDRIIVNRDHVISRAKERVIQLEEDHYRAPVKRHIPVVGEGGYATLVLGAQMMKYGGLISDHDLKIAKKLAFVIAGGRVPKGTYVDEQYLLDLEREAFLSLVGERKTMERMQHMLLTGKPLRN